MIFSISPYPGVFHVKHTRDFLLQKTALFHVKQPRFPCK